MTALEQCLKTACDCVRDEVGAGQVANYIPALARTDAHKFGAEIVTVNGETALYGDAAEGFSIQSISKLFTLTLALEKSGEELWQRVGREPSGNSFGNLQQPVADVLQVYFNQMCHQTQLPAISQSGSAAQ